MVGECGGSKPPFGKKIANGEGAKKNNSAFSATHTYIKLTLVSFFLLFFFAPSPNWLSWHCPDIKHGTLKRYVTP